MDNLICAMNQTGSVGIVAINSKNILQEIQKIHHTSPLVSAALGRLLTAAILMDNSAKKEESSLAITLDCEGPLGRLVAEVGRDGQVRAYAQNPALRLPACPGGQPDITLATGGKGLLTVVKKRGNAMPYTGQIAIISGDISGDIRAYLAQSEQMEGFCVLAEDVADDGRVLAAGGYLLSFLPGTTEEDKKKIDCNRLIHSDITPLLCDNSNADALLAAIMAGLSPRVIAQKELCYRCLCSEEKCRELLASLPQEEQKNLWAENDTTEMVCHFCNRRYRIKLDDIS